jgi:hypothetical protein
MASTPKESSLYTNPVDGTQSTFANIAGHRDVAATECPGGVFYATLPGIRADVAALITGSAPAADFSLSVSPSSKTVTRGRSTTFDGDDQPVRRLRRLRKPHCQRPPERRDRNVQSPPRGQLVDALGTHEHHHAAGHLSVDHHRHERRPDPNHKREPASQEQAATVRQLFREDQKRNVDLDPHPADARDRRPKAGLVRPSRRDSS